MKRNFKKEINEMILNEYLPEIQSNFVDEKLTDEGRQIVTECVNKCLNLVRRHELDYRDLDSECFSYDGKGNPMFSEDKIIELVSTTIYLKLVDVSKKDKSDFLGLNQYDNDSLYNWKRKQPKSLSYCENFNDGDDTLEPLTITPMDLWNICNKKGNSFENLFMYYYSDEDLLHVVKILFTDLFKRINKENQQFLIDWTKQQLHSRGKTNIQHKKIDEFINQRIRYTECSRATQLILCKICDN